MMRLIRATVVFRDGSKRVFPDDRSVSIVRYFVEYQEGIVRIIDQDGNSVTYPLDLVLYVEETPEPRF